VVVVGGGVKRVMVVVVRGGGCKMRGRGRGEVVGGGGKRGVGVWD